MSCEDEVSYQMYCFFLKSQLQVLHWHPPGGKKYFTRHLRIPYFSGSVRKGRYRVDLVLANKNLLVLIECKCALSEATEDVAKLRTIRNSIGLEKLKRIFLRQGVHIDTQVNRLLLGIGVRYVDMSIPDDLIVFEVKSTEKLDIHRGLDIDEKSEEMLFESVKLI